MSKRYYVVKHVEDDYESYINFDNEDENARPFCDFHEAKIHKSKEGALKSLRKIAKINRKMGFFGKVQVMEIKLKSTSASIVNMPEKSEAKKKKMTKEMKAMKDMLELHCIDFKVDEGCLVLLTDEGKEFAVLWHVEKANWRISPSLDGERVSMSMFVSMEMEFIFLDYDDAIHMIELTKRLASHAEKVSDKIHNQMYKA